MNDGDRADTGAHARGTLVWAIRTAGIAGFVALAATQYLARGTADIAGATRIAQARAGQAAFDPETTGSIAKGARSVRLDPCSAASASRAPRP